MSPTPFTSCGSAWARCCSRSRAPSRRRPCTTWSPGSGRTCSEPASSGCVPLSALAGTGSVSLGGLIAARLAGRARGTDRRRPARHLPLLVWFSQEARAYALATLLTAAPCCSCSRYADGHAPGDLAGWAVLRGPGALHPLLHRLRAFARRVWLAVPGRRPARCARPRHWSGPSRSRWFPLALAQRGTGHADYIAHDA